MPRVNKKDAAAAAAIAAAPVASVTEQHPAELLDEAPQGNVVVPIAAFLNLRDSILKGLGAIQDVVTQMNSTYISSTNAMLIESGFDERYLTSIMARAPAPEASISDDKKEKKKRVHDPNAPKRPLTPFFLYMQTARPIIAADLGPDQPKKAVGVEGVRRWKEMAEGDKQLWTNAYTDNLKLYNARVHAYKAGNMNAKDMDDAEAAHYAETHNVAALPGDELDLAADAQLSAEHLGELPGDMASTPTSPEASPEPPKIPAATPKAKTARAKKGKQTPVATPQTIEAPVVPIVPSSTQKAASPDKKRKRGSAKKADEVVASIESEETPKNKSGGRKKKARGE